MKIKFPLSESAEATITLSVPNQRHAYTKQLSSDEFDNLETGLSAMREQVTGEKFVPDTEPAEYGDSVLIPASVLAYAATALESQVDRGDRYCASQIRDALRQPHATYPEDD